MVSETNFQQHTPSPMPVRSSLKPLQIYICSHLHHRRASMSTWTQYKHYNTVKFLVACTPNGAICFISPVYVGSISDIELTRQSGFLTVLKDKPDVAIRAARGFMIKDML